MIEIQNVRASGRRSGWWKHITAVNVRGAGARNFQGSFLAEGEHVLPPGSLLLHVFPGGTAASKLSHVELWRVTTAGTKIRLGGRLNWKLDLERVKARARSAFTEPVPLPVFREITPEDKEHPMLPALRKLAPAVVIRSCWEPCNDTSEAWDPAWGDRDDFELYEFSVVAEAIVEGTKVSGEAYLGGCYELYGKTPDMDCQGYFPQKVEEALVELRARLSASQSIHSAPLVDQTLAACEFCEQWLQERYESHVTKKNDSKSTRSKPAAG